jgi:hypothetical protein
MCKPFELSRRRVYLRSSIPQLFREDGIAVGRREELLEQKKAFPEIPAGKLARASIHVDVAANAVQVKS